MSEDNTIAPVAATASPPRLSSPPPLSSTASPPAAGPPQSQQGQQELERPISSSSSAPRPQPLPPQRTAATCDDCAPMLLLIHRMSSIVPTSEPPAPMDSILTGASAPSFFSRETMSVLYNYLTVWVQKQCVCLFRHAETVDMFCFLMQQLTRFSVQQLKSIRLVLDGSASDDHPTTWSVDEMERFLLFMAKVFILQFPLYAGPKQVGHRFEDVGTAEGTQLAVFCDVHDSTDFPVALLRNVMIFCKSGGLQGMADAFKLPSLMPPSMAHALISILCNIKLWLNYRAVLQLFGPVRSAALGYMCQLSDQELRAQPARNMADYLWCTMKDNVEAPIVFDRDGLELARKYFVSTTLTMRLCGITQINSHINMFNEMCNSESVVEVENVGLKLAGWILHNKIVEHIFGPNLHVEVIKQSHILLNFLAVEGKISSEHVNVIWQAAQLKHCSKQVHDLLLPLIKNLEAGPVLHLYEQMKNLPMKDHTEQTIHLAQVLQKFIWTSGGALSSILQEANALQQQQQQHQQQQAVAAAAAMLNKNAVAAAAVGNKDDPHSASSSDDDSSSAAAAAVAAAASRQALSIAAAAAVVQKNKSLLDKSVIVAAAAAAAAGRTASSEGGGQLSLEDDDDVDDEAFNEYSDDEDDEEEEEDEDDDDDDEIPTSDEEENQREGGPRPQAPQSAKRVQSASGSSDQPIPKPPTSTSTETSSASSLPPLVAISQTAGSDSWSSPANDDNGSRASPSGKRTKGLPVKGIKRSRMPTPEPVTPSKDNAKVCEKRPRVAQAANVGSRGATGEKNTCWWPNGGPDQKKSGGVMAGSSSWKPNSDSSAGVAAQPSTSSSPMPPPPMSGPSTAMAELANLVNAHPRSALGPLKMQQQSTTGEMLDMRSPLGRLAAQQMALDEAAAAAAAAAGLSGDNDSRSSRFSDKNLGDFEDENSVDEEMLQLTENHEELGAFLQHQQQQFANMASLYQQRLAVPSRLTTRQRREEARIMANYKLDSICEAGNTLLWDLLQDGAIEQLAEGLAMEAEKSLTQLLCLNMDHFIRMKFIEGCLANVQKNSSVAISLRLLPKLLQSFQQNFRGGVSNGSTHDITMFTERRHGMMHLFFTNLQTYTRERFEGRECPPFFNHMAQIQIRLQFLSGIFSSQVSPLDFRLNSEQINVLWECVVDTDPLCTDELFQWLLMQVHNREQHAIGIDGFRLIYDEKLPTLKPETISMLGLNLFSQLCHISRMNRPANAANNADTNIKMEQLWRIALCAQNTDVSQKAIQILNSVYFGQGEEFLATCMRSLRTASQDLAPNSKDEILIRIQRALLLLKTYLETFRRKYAYHFRRLSIDGQGVSTHAELVDSRAVGPIRIVVQAADGFQEKATLEMQCMDLVADLRAEISAWWEGKVVPERAAATEKGGDAVVTTANAVSGGSGGPLRIITQGQEVSPELDEKTLIETRFKDLQLCYVSQGRGAAPAGFNRGSSDTPQFPGKDRMPMNTLLEPENFEQLFVLMQSLSNLRVRSEKGTIAPHPKAQILSRRVWDILMLLPTNPHIKDVFQHIERTSEEKMRQLLCAKSPQKLMYTFYIVDWLGRPVRLRRHSGVVEPSGDGSISCSPATSAADQPWILKFIASGGLRLLFEIFASGELQQRDDSSVWCEWKQDCLSALLKLLVQFGVDSHDYAALADQLVEASNLAAAAAVAAASNSTPRKKSKRLHGGGGGLRHNSGAAFGGGGGGAGEQRLLVPRLSSTMLSLVSVDVVIPRLSSVLIDASYNKDSALQQYRTGVFGRAQVVHFAISLLVAWLYSSEDVEDAFLASNNLPAWLRSLLLEDPDPAVRRELSTGLYKLCMGSTTGGRRAGISCTAPLLSILLEFLDDALVMLPMRRDSTPLQQQVDDGKEPFGPACRDYFWILHRLVDNLHPPPGGNGEPVDANGLIDLDQLARQLAGGLVSRKLFEKRHGDSTPDDTLIGTLHLLNSVMKHQPQFKTSPEGQELLAHLWDCLFALPSPKEKDLPKCKSPASRNACYDLLVEMCRGSRDNYLLLHTRLIAQHQPDAHKSYPWEYWPKEDGRADCGYVGLTNLGATCYMASCMQQLYMIPQARSVILKSELLMEEKIQMGKNDSTLHEMQRMFAYLRESERKAYNPISFCKNYQMDHQPLNTGEQKDMAEFFIDLLSKMEDMTPELRRIVKKLFCGTLTNNVVSLDCKHVSRTAEEFYTVRCQVSEMRNLQQSLEEVTVKDTLEGDNMYTCSQCEKKVRAEKRACFKKLPKIIAFNTMRYSFNIFTMLKEKVNTHFSFPFRLDMSPYMEQNLVPTDKEDVEKKEASEYEGKGQQKEGHGHKIPKEEEGVEEEESHEYELIGVTVHTGNADGGHYYAFIRDRGSGSRDKWYSFNDAEVKPFDPNQIATECFGGEVNSRTYDQVTDKFMDLSIEKTNSAYMLFYERVPKRPQLESRAGPSFGGIMGRDEKDMATPTTPEKATFDLSNALETWIWQDNTNFIQDNNIFDHSYFNFMWQMVGFIPTTFSERSQEDITLLSAKMSTSFFLESFIHAKEKLNIVQWVELLTKQFDSSMTACRWFLDKMAGDPNWPVTIFLKCQVATIRQMFMRLCIHVIQKLRSQETTSYMLPWVCKDPDLHPSDEMRSKIGAASPITRFIRTLLTLLDSGAARPHLKYLSEFHSFLYDFAKLGEEETRFLVSIQAISTLIDFYLKVINQSPDSNNVDVVSDDDDDDDDDIIALTPIGSEANKMASLEKAIFLIALLVEKSRGEDNLIHLSSQDKHFLIGGGARSFIGSARESGGPLTSSSGKSLVFLYNVIKDNINPNATCNLIFSLTRNNPALAEHVVNMVFHGVKQPDFSVYFFRMLTLLTDLVTSSGGAPAGGSSAGEGGGVIHKEGGGGDAEGGSVGEKGGGPSGLPCFTSLVMHRVWDLAKFSPQGALDWLSIQVARNRIVRSWLLGTMENWVEPHLLTHMNQKVRSSAAFLVISLVPSTHFRSAFRRQMPLPMRDNLLNDEDTEILHQVLKFLLGLLQSARRYTDYPDYQQHSTGKLGAYFQTLNHCLLTKSERLMLEPHFDNLWNLFHPKLSEPSIPVHHNKLVLLSCWYNLCVDCPENVRLIVNNPQVVKNIAFNYILADHEDTDVVNFNRAMLPTYYGLLRVCCEESLEFRRTLAQHQNIQWAFKNITPFTTQYHMACDELFKLMALFVQKPKSGDDNFEERMAEIRQFRHQTLQLYLSILDGRSSWTTLIQVLRILVDTDEDRIFVVYNNGLSLVYDAINMLHVMYHEATACHITSEIIELVVIFQQLLRAVKNHVAVSRTNDGKANCSSADGNSSAGEDIMQILSRWKDMADITNKLFTLVNSFTPMEMREKCIAAVRQMLMLWPKEMLSILVPMLHRAHVTAAAAGCGAGGTEAAAAAAAAAGAGGATRGGEMTLGPYFPRKGSIQLASVNLRTVRPPRPMLQISVPVAQLESHHGLHPEYDAVLYRYFHPYHHLVDFMVRLAVNEDSLSKMLVDLSAMVGLEGVPLHLQLFPKLWLDIFNTEVIDRKYVSMLVQSRAFLEYVMAVLIEERSSLNNQYVFNFMVVFFPKVARQVLTEHVQATIAKLVNNLAKVAPTFLLTNPAAVNHLNGDLRALFLVNTPGPVHLTPQLLHALHVLRGRVEVAYASVKKAVCDDGAEDTRRRESADSREDGESKNDDASSSHDDTEEQKDDSSGRQRWKSTSGILAGSEDDDFGSKSRHSSTPGRSVTGSAPLVESLGGMASSNSGGTSVAEDHMARLRDAYSLFLTTSGMLVNMCKKKLGIDEEGAGVGVQDASAADNSGGENCGEDAGDADATTHVTKE